jgi:hypothetical protein
VAREKESVWWPTVVCFPVRKFDGIRTDSGFCVLAGLMRATYLFCDGFDVASL